MFFIHFFHTTCFFLIYCISLFLTNVHAQMLIAYIYIYSYINKYLFVIARLYGLDVMYKYNFYFIDSKNHSHLCVLQCYPINNKRMATDGDTSCLNFHGERGTQCLPKAVGLIEEEKKSYYAERKGIFTQAAFCGCPSHGSTW